jgi:hypothetical protein
MLMDFFGWTGGYQPPDLHGIRSKHNGISSRNHVKTWKITPVFVQFQCGIVAKCGMEGV